MVFYVIAIVNGGNLFIAGIFNSIFFVKSKELNEQSVKIFCSGTNKNLFRLDMHSPELF